jgi:hypothetical protein
MVLSVCFFRLTRYRITPPTAPRALISPKTIPIISEVERSFRGLGTGGWVVGNDEEDVVVVTVHVDDEGSVVGSDGEEVSVGCTVVVMVDVRVVRVGVATLNVEERWVTIACGGT